MENTYKNKAYRNNCTIATFAACFLGLAVVSTSPSMATDAGQTTPSKTPSARTQEVRNGIKPDTALDAAVKDTLEKCKKISPSCADSSKSSAGILVFPEVIKADLIIGGSGGKGALVQNGKVTDYYSIGAISAGLQAGVENTSHVYVFNTPQSLSQLKEGADWKMGTTADVTLVTADASARATTGNVLAYIFDAEGLHAGISLDAFRIWKSSNPRPE